MNKKQLIIDVREPVEYQSGHVAGAINIPSGDLISQNNALGKIDKNTQLIVYCRTGNRSNASIQILKQRGFTNLINGINADHVTKHHLVD